MSSSELKKLVGASRNGDRNAFGKIVLQLASVVTGVAYSVCGDFARSEDIGQEVFFEAWKKLASLEDDSKFTAWICKIARRRAIDEVRRSARRPAVALNNEPLESVELNPETVMQSNQKRELVWSMLEQLPETYRETMVLYYRSEQSVTEVAGALGESEPTIRQRLKRGREMLRVELADLVGDTIRSTIPKAAFATAVMASLPATTYAAGAAGTTAVASKTGAGGAGGALWAGLGAAFSGALIGLGGALLGVWCSWTSAEYKSLQTYMVRQMLYYFAGVIVFVVAMFALIAARKNGMLDSTTFGICNLFFVLTAVSLSMIWLIYFLAGWKKIQQHEIESGTPRRKKIAANLKRACDETRVVREDGTVGYEIHQWKFSSWFGSMLGGSAWMIPCAAVLAYHGNNVAAAVTTVCFAIAIFATLLCWWRREHLKALNSLLWMIFLLAVLTMTVLASFQFLTNEQGQAALSWHPLCWFVLLLFPGMAYLFCQNQRTAEKWLKERDMQTK